MLTENTITKLQQMRLSAMANAFREQQMDPNMASLSFEDRFGLLVDREWTTRKSNHLRKLIKNAGFAEPGACVEDIEYHSDRNLDKAQIARFATCTYIAEHHTGCHRQRKDLSCLCSGYGGSTKLPDGKIYPPTGTSGRTRHCKSQWHLPEGDPAV